LKEVLASHQLPIEKHYLNQQCQLGGK